MIIATDLAGNSEIINKFSNFEMYEELNGGFTLSFTSFNHPDNPGHNLITQEGFIEYDGYKFRIKQLRKQMNATQVSCLSAYYDNFDKWKYDIYGGTHTLSEFMTYVLADTGWTWVAENIDTSKTWAFKNVDTDPSDIVFNFGQNNVIRLMEQLKTTFGFELRIDRGSQVTISNKLGPDNDAQYRYGYNVVSLTESIDTTKLKTYIEGFGANGLHVTYTSPYSSNPGIGIRHAEPIYDDSFTDSNLLLEHIKKQLTDYPESSIELGDVSLLDKAIGESVWVIHERMGIEYQTRVVAKRIKLPSSQSSVTLGTYTPQSRSLGNVLATQQVTIDKNNAISKSRIEQTNEKILFEVSRLDGVDAVTQSSITVSADSIRSEVSTQVTRLDGRVDSSNSLISQQASEILLRVRKDGVISSINLTPEVVRIAASKIDLQGSVTISDLDPSASGRVTRITADGLYTGTINADSIISGSLTGRVVRTAETGSRIQMDPLGIRSYNSSNQQHGVDITSDNFSFVDYYYQGGLRGRVGHAAGLMQMISIIGGIALTPSSGSQIDMNGVVDFNGYTPIGINLTAKFG